MKEDQTVEHVVEQVHSEEHVVEQVHSERFVYGRYIDPTDTGKKEYEYLWLSHETFSTHEQALTMAEHSSDMFGVDYEVFKVVKDEKIFRNPEPHTFESTSVVHS